MYNSIEDVKRIRSLQSAQVRGHAGVLNNYYGNHRMNKSRKELTTISVSRENYLSLKKLGCSHNNQEYGIHLWKDSGGI